MKSTFRIAGGIAIAVALLASLSAMAVSAQGPGGTETPGATQTPVQAPPLAAGSSTNVDSPLQATLFGAQTQNIGANSAQWYRFDYDTNGNALPRPTVTIRMLNGAMNGLQFEVWSTERMLNNWWDNDPVGRGSQETVQNCNNIAGQPQVANATTLENNTTKCTTNDLTWTGGFGAPGTYYVRVHNPTNNSVAPQLIIYGPGLMACTGPNATTNTAQNTTTNTNSNTGTTQSSTSASAQGQAFARLQCQPYTTTTTSQGQGG